MNSNKHTIAIIEDDIALGSALKKSLEYETFHVLLFQNIKSFSEAVNSNKLNFNLLLLDWMLPDGQGIDFLKEFRKTNNATPVIMLTARSELIDKIVGLENGATDYMVKPFEIRELVARIRTLINFKYQVSINIQNENTTRTSIKLENTNILLEINLLNRKVCFNQKIVELTKMEYELLKILCESPGQVFSRDALLDKVWGFENFPTTRTIDTHVLQLRQKFSPDIIDTVRGIGYRLGESFYCQEKLTNNSQQVDS